ncbi:hypothetical protein BCV71DRAFT_235219 [Rhizopus microsporus]|uniref:Uncharacterized protein n=1 Tax=Rhizopus microsporus TaxID=58291 RepID=A0A1X0S1C7_RHIZD|nr:hypothetical protein BCV71DRAFT_235219 [Rhizopus microsporus]
MYHFISLRILYSWHLKLLIVMIALSQAYSLFIHLEMVLLQMLPNLMSLLWFLIDVIEKHEDFVYDLNGNAVTGNQCVENFSSNVSVVKYYNMFISDHCHMGFDLATANVCFGRRITTVANIIENSLSRIPTTVKEHLTENKNTPSYTLSKVNVTLSNVKAILLQSASNTEMIL